MLTYRNSMEFSFLFLFHFFSKKPKLIESWGYKAEEHFVTTEDGYTLTLHRIPGRPNPETGNRKIPVLLGHCLVGTSAIWAFGPAENSLAYLLADQGLCKQQ
jgi:lysosomal acid lipase/cholesteryl ester hydrolase